MVRTSELGGKDHDTYREILQLLFYTPKLWGPARSIVVSPFRAREDTSRRSHPIYLPATRQEGTSNARSIHEQYQDTRHVPPYGLRQGALCNPLPKEEHRSKDSTGKTNEL